MNAIETASATPGAATIPSVAELFERSAGNNPRAERPRATIPSVAELFERAKQLPPGEQDALIDNLVFWQKHCKEAAERSALGARTDAAPVPDPAAGLPQPDDKKKLVIPDYAARLREDFPDGGLKGDPQEFWDYVRAERF